MWRDNEIPDPPVTPKPAASVMLLRQGAGGMEVLMIRRHGDANFAGALAFPGGKLDPEDRDPGLVAHARGLDGLDGGARARRLAAIRELFEETGILLATEAGSEEFVTADRAGAISDRFRGALHAGEVGLREIAEAEGIVYACDRLVDFAHWTAPEYMLVRFDARFFLAVAPPGQEARHDGAETVETVWIGPGEALALADAEQDAIVFPTRMNLLKLGKSADMEAALAAAAAHPVVPVLPKRVRRADGTFLEIAPAAGLGFTEVAMDEVPLEVFPGFENAGEKAD